MLALHGVSAWIQVEGKELEQYGVEENVDRNEVTCWIAAQANKNFSVAFRDTAAYRDHSLTSSLNLDGSAVPGHILHPPNHPFFVKGRTVVQDGQTLSATSSCPFIFSKLELTDEDEYLNQSSSHLGEIRIKIYRVLHLETRAFQSGSSASSHGKIHERSKKAVTHCVSYGEEVKTSATFSCRVRHLDGNVPLATFVFKYRDFSLLQANGIIPRPPPAMSLANVLDLTTGNVVKREPGEEIEIVGGTTQKRPASLLSKRSNASNEREVRSTKRIKREKNLVHGEIIDLT